eukprot:g8689.t1
MADRLCEIGGCKRLAYFAEAEGSEPKFCSSHKQEVHWDVRKKSCEVPECAVKPNYGFEGGAPRFCAAHKLEGMKNLSRGCCKHAGCLKYASCGMPGGSPVFCGEHKQANMINLNGRRCSRPNCQTHASYGIEGMRARFCAKHKDINMLNLTVRKCEFDGCLAQPTCNRPELKKPRFCGKHCPPGMVDILDRHCKQIGCDRQPIYGNSGEKTGRPVWCPDHRPEDSCDVKTSRCQEVGCLKHPSYGFLDDRVRRRCRLHKLPGMIDVKSPKCETPMCPKQPCCGHLGAKARFCSEHKQSGMVNLKTRAFRCKHKEDQKVDDEETSTEEEEERPDKGAKGGKNKTKKKKKKKKKGKSIMCNRACRYAFPNEPAVYCAMHALDGMVDVLNPQCSMDDCLEIPTYGFPGEQPTFCMAHHGKGMQVIMPQSTNIMHWSSEARRQAAASALEAKRVASQRDAGSAKVSLLPPKKDLDGLLKIEKAHNAAKAVAAAKEPATGNGFTEVTASDLALAFGSSIDNPMDDTDEDGDVDVSAVSSTRRLQPRDAGPRSAVDARSAGGGSGPDTNQDNDPVCLDAAAYALESVAGRGKRPARSAPGAVAAAAGPAATAAATAVASLRSRGRRRPSSPRGTAGAAVSFPAAPYAGRNDGSESGGGAGGYDAARGGVDGGGSPGAGVVGPRVGMALGASGVTAAGLLYGVGGVGGGGGGGAGFPLPMLPALPPPHSAAPAPPVVVSSQAPPYASAAAYAPPAAVGVNGIPTTTSPTVSGSHSPVPRRRPARLPGIDLERAVNVDRAATVAAALATAAKGNPFTNRAGRRATGKAPASRAWPGGGGSDSGGGSGSGRGGGSNGGGGGNAGSAAAAGEGGGRARRPAGDTAGAHPSTRGGSGNARKRHRGSAAADSGTENGATPSPSPPQTASRAARVSGRQKKPRTANEKANHGLFGVHAYDDYHERVRQYPLHQAVATGRVDIVQFMLGKGYDVDEWDEDGRTPLQEVAKWSRGSVATAEAFLAAGAYLDFRCRRKDMSALDVAAAWVNVSVAKSVLDWAASKRSGDIAKLIIEHLVEHGVDLNTQGFADRTALHVAARYGMAEVVGLLLKAGADVDREDISGDTRLHVALPNSSSATAVALLNHGASATKQNARGHLPLHFAAAAAGLRGSTKIVDLLLRKGADEKAISNNGKTAADVVGGRVRHSYQPEAEDVRKLLANAPADRAWRRRGLLVLCRAHYPSGRVQLGHGSIHAHDAGIAKRTRSHPTPSRTEAD